MEANNHFNTAILVIFFNRPDTLKEVLLKIREVKAPVLYLAQDGARADNLVDLENIKACREIVRLVIDWDCEIKTLYREKNLGCRRAVSSAIDWFFSSEKEGIILEDDCVPDTSFFSYAQYMLRKYRNDTDVGMVCGSNVTNTWFPKVDEDIYFSKMPLVWGWASWRRVWNHYDIDIKSWPDNKSIIDFLSDKALIKNWTSIFHRVFIGKIKSWDYQLNYLFWTNKLICIIPKNNLIENIGFDSRATHTIVRPDYLTNDNIAAIRVDSDWQLPMGKIINSGRDLKFLENQLDPKVNSFKVFCLEVLVFYKSFLDKLKGESQ